MPQINPLIDPPPPFEVSTAGETTTITLPPRKNRPLTRLYGLMLVLLSTALPLMIHFWLRFQLVFAFFHAWHFLIALLSTLPYGLGLMLTGHVTITLDPRSLNIRRRAGFFNSQTHIIPQIIARLELDVPDVFRRSVLPNNTSLNAELSSGARIPIAQGYPRELLAALASELAARINIPDSADAAPSPLAIIDVTDIPPAARDVLTQPPGSLIKSADIAGLKTYSVDRIGKLQSPLEFIAILLVLTLLLSATTFSTILLLLHFRPGHLHWIPPLLTFGLTVLFVSLLLNTIHTFFNRCIIIVTPDTLTRTTRSPFKKTELHWNRHQIAQLRTEGAANRKSFTISERNTILYVKSTAGEKFTLLTGHELDLRWLATQLRTELNLPNR